MDRVDNDLIGFLLLCHLSETSIVILICDFDLSLTTYGQFALSWPYGFFCFEPFESFVSSLLAPRWRVCPVYVLFPNASHILREAFEA